MCQIDGIDEKTINQTLWRRRVAGMKQGLLMIVLVALVGGCASTSTQWVSDPSDPNNVIIEKEIRKRLGKPTGELTKAELAKVTYLCMSSTNITDAGLNDIAKLQELKYLLLYYTQITDAGLNKLEK